MSRRKQLEVYLHFPFCIRKCRYCDFLSAPADPLVRTRYIGNLKEDIRQTELDTDYEIVSIFFGGGTPSLMEPEQTADIMDVLRDCCRIREGAEITMECNPGTLTGEKLEGFRRAGINRLSIGLQSADDQELSLLGRIHTWKEFRENYDAARGAGFSNINIDLMFSLPGQTIQSWMTTLKKVLECDPEHISAYSLIIEEGTPFYDLYHQEDEARAQGRAVRLLPDEDAEREMYDLTGRILEDAGLYRYEISNYAKAGFESVHNSGYWQRREYAGFGLGAASLLDGHRFRKTRRLDRYLRGDFSRREEIALTEKDAMEETMFLGLRMMQGVSRDGFEELFHVSMEQIYGKVIRNLKQERLLCEEAGRVFLSRRGIDVSNRVLAEFLLDE